MIQALQNEFRETKRPGTFEGFKIESTSVGLKSVSVT
ncbi:MAG: hypothetical protein UX68_C0033G0006 [Parcubacteria group bacterium GW2011_GWA2_46_9]|nr:MAG: hypothetical protein UX68_C0033G0006 [Parcubacteria group bacterium GW2011_GWA2_46_9]